MKHAEHFAAPIALGSAVAAQLIVLFARGNPAELTSASTAVPILLMGVWSIAAIGLLLHRIWAFPTSVVAAITLICHGAVLRTAFDPLGVVMLLLGGVAFAFAIRSHRDVWLGHPRWFTR